jgi:Fic-DOC domain mobile mystery protein B
MELDLEYTDGQTPLDPEELQGLKIRTIATRGELDEFEQQNIEQAVLWSMRQHIGPEALFTEDFIRALHRQMYGHVWAWAGEFRNTQKNLGADWWKIPGELRQLLNDTRYWITHDTFGPDELTLRFKHRLVAIHCFSNGNGRHSRLMADIIIEKIFGMPVFTWGGINLVKPGEARRAYLAAIKAADRGDMRPLLAFARN